MSLCVSILGKTSGGKTTAVYSLLYMMVADDKEIVLNKIGTERIVQDQIVGFSCNEEMGKDEKPHMPEDQLEVLRQYSEKIHKALLRAIERMKELVAHAVEATIKRIDEIRNEHSWDIALWRSRIQRFMRKYAQNLQFTYRITVKKRLCNCCVQLGCTQNTEEFLMKETVNRRLLQPNQVRLCIGRRRRPAPKEWTLGSVA